MNESLSLRDLSLRSHCFPIALISIKGSRIITDLEKNIAPNPLDIEALKRLLIYLQKNSFEVKICLEIPYPPENLNNLICLKPSIPLEKWADYFKNLRHRCMNILRSPQEERL